MCQTRSRRSQSTAINKSHKRISLSLSLSLPFLLYHKSLKLWGYGSEREKRHKKMSEVCFMYQQVWRKKNGCQIFFLSFFLTFRSLLILYHFRIALGSSVDVARCINCIMFFKDANFFGLLFKVKDFRKIPFEESGVNCTLLLPQI